MLVKKENSRGQVWVRTILGTRLCSVTSCCLSQAEIRAQFAQLTPDFFPVTVVLFRKKPPPQIDCRMKTRCWPVIQPRTTVHRVFVHISGGK